MAAAMQFSCHYFEIIHLIRERKSLAVVNIRNSRAVAFNVQTFV